MTRRLQILTVIAGLILVSWASNDKFPTDKVKRTFKRLLSDTTETDFGFINISTVRPIVDSSFIELLPNTDFYFLIIQNGSHWEYNNGRIQTVAAVSRTGSNDVRLLLPQSYAKSSTNFFNLFYGKTIKNKEKMCKSVSNLFLKTYTRNACNCDKEMRSLHQTILSTDSTFTVITAWTENCWDPTLDKKEAKEYLVNKSTTFSFKDDILTNIEYKDWRR